ncbi:MAG TPA: hypothetical protein VGC47_13025 [Acidimicrobiia bacterium]
MTRLTTTDEINAVLERYLNLTECILDDVVWRDFGTTIDLVFDNVWAEAWKLRQDVNDVRDPVVMRLYSVQTVRLDNALNDYMVAEPWMLDWGLAEVEWVEAVDVEGSPLAHGGRGIRRIDVKGWGARHLRAEFVDMEFVPSPDPDPTRGRFDPAVKRGIAATHVGLGPAASERPPRRKLP